MSDVRMITSATFFAGRSNSAITVGAMWFTDETSPLHGRYVNRRTACTQAGRSGAIGQGRAITRMPTL
jgi:hypothetical protein